LAGQGRLGVQEVPQRLVEIFRDGRIVIGGGEEGAQAIEVVAKREHAGLGVGMVEEALYAEVRQGAVEAFTVWARPP
jgi:protein-L-isoaspartate O-methyltransferase